MVSHAESEEQLGENAPAGVPALDVDKKGDPARWRDMNQPDRVAGDQLMTPEQGAVMQTPPTSGPGGEPEEGETTGHEDVTTDRPA